MLGIGICLPNTFRRLLSDASRQPSLTKGPTSASAVASDLSNAQLFVGDLHPADVPDAGPRGFHHRREEVCVCDRGCIKESLFSCTDVQGRFFRLVSRKTSRMQLCKKCICFFCLKNQHTANTSRAYPKSAAGFRYWPV